MGEERRARTTRTRAKAYKVVVEHLLGVAALIIGVQAQSAPVPRHVGPVVLLQVVVRRGDKRARLGVPWIKAR